MRSIKLFKTNAQEVSHLVDTGDKSEPGKLCSDSLVRVDDDTGRFMVLTGEELTDLSRQWLAQPGVNKIKPPPYQRKVKR